MINNGTLHYDHDRDGTHTQLAGCEAKFRNFEHDTHIAIRYERDTLTGIIIVYFLIIYDLGRGYVKRKTSIVVKIKCLSLLNAFLIS